MVPWLYKWLPIFFGCHCMDSRSFHYRNTRFPICARCTGELVGILAAAILYAFIHPGLLWSALLLIPLVIDGGVQSLTRYESTNGKRLFTGILFGYGLVNLFLLTTGLAFQWGVRMGEQLTAH